MLKANTEKDGRSGYLSVLIERGTEDGSAPVLPSRFARLVKKYEFEMHMFPFE